VGATGTLARLTRPASRFIYLWAHKHESFLCLLGYQFTTMIYTKKAESEMVEAEAAAHQQRSPDGDTKKQK
jgi:hypothetical protein